MQKENKTQNSAVKLANKNIADRIHLAKELVHVTSGKAKQKLAEVKSSGVLQLAKKYPYKVWINSWIPSQSGQVWIVGITSPIFGQVHLVVESVEELAKQVRLGRDVRGHSPPDRPPSCYQAPDSGRAA